MSPKKTTAEKLMEAVGSWKYIGYQTIFLAIWLTLNGVLLHFIGFHPWDPYPFILLNLFLSFAAAYTGPVILMGQNELSKRDKVREEQQEAHEERWQRRMEEMTEAILNMAKTGQIRDKDIIEMLSLQTETIKEQTHLLNHMTAIFNKTVEGSSEHGT